MKIVRLLAAIGLAILPTLSMALPVRAISNPTTIGFGAGGIYPSYRVFVNCLETGDMFFAAEGYVYYAVTPTDYAASQAFIFSVANATGTIVSTPIKQYGDRPIGIYLSKNQTTTYGLVSGGAYIIRISGNPFIFPSSVGNTVNATLTPGQYIDQSTATVTINPLRMFCINLALNMQAVDSVSTYLTTVQGTQYLTTTGGTLFLEGMPGLDTIVPSLFQAGTSPLVIGTSSGNGTYGKSISVAAVFGTTTSEGIKNLGIWMGFGAANGGAMVLLVLGIFIAFMVVAKTGSPAAALVIVVALPFIGGYLGLMNLAMSFVFGFVIVVVFAYYFFTRGIL